MGSIADLENCSMAKKTALCSLTGLGVSRAHCHSIYCGHGLTVRLITSKNASLSGLPVRFTDYMSITIF